MSRPANIATLTGLRAYAACWVMLLHLQHGVGIKDHVAFGAFIDHGGWAVDIFFVLSGFILSLLYAETFDRRFELRAWGRYLSARFARIYPLHLLGLGALAAYYFGARALAGTPLPPGFSLGNFALNVSLLHGWGFAERLSWNYPSWSIGTEWFAYLFMLPILARALRRVSPLAVLAIGLVAWTALYLAVHRLDQTIGTQNVKWGIPRIAVEFLLGYALYRIHRVVRLGDAASNALTLIGLATIVALGFSPAAFEWLLAPAVCALLLGLTGPGLVGQRLFGSPRAVFWGERSYSIYMLHAVVQIYCNLLLDYFGWTSLGAAQAWVLVAVQAAVVLLASHMAYGFVEVPARNRLRQLAERRLAGAAAAPAAGTQVGQA